MPFERAIVGIFAGAVLLSAACQLAPTSVATPGPTLALRPTAAPPAKPAAVASPSPSAAASPGAAASPLAAASPRSISTVTPPASSASRVEVLNAAETAFRSGEPGAAAALYERVTNTPPSPGESADGSMAIVDYAYFRGAIALLAAGREDDARAQLDALQAHDPSSPLARLGAQLWDQYGMTAQLRSACAQLQPQLASQAAPVLATLTAQGVDIQPERVCSVP